MAKKPTAKAAKKPTAKAAKKTGVDMSGLKTDAPFCRGMSDLIGCCESLKFVKENWNSGKHGEMPGPMQVVCRGAMDWLAGYKANITSQSSKMKEPPYDEKTSDLGPDGEEEDSKLD